MNVVEVRPMDHPPQANWNWCVWRSGLAAQEDAYAFPTVQRGRCSWKGNAYCSRRMGDGTTHQRRMSNDNVNSRRFHSKKRKKFGYRFAPFAPRNTTSFIIRAKRSGGIASLFSPPCPVTLKTPLFSPLPEVLVDLAKAEWGVDSYGSMKGLIRLRADARDEDGELSDIDVEERMLDLDLSRFELIYPSVREVVSTGGNAILDSRLNYRDLQMAQLNKEKQMMNEKLSRMERDMQDMRRRIQCLENYSGITTLENAMVEGSDCEMRGCCVGSEKSIGDGYYDAGQSLALRDDMLLSEMLSQFE